MAPAIDEFHNLLMLGGGALPRKSRCRARLCASRASCGA